MKSINVIINIARDRRPRASDSVDRADNGSLSHECGNEGEEVCPAHYECGNEGEEVCPAHYR